MPDRHELDDTTARTDAMKLSPTRTFVHHVYKQKQEGSDEIVKLQETAASLHSHGGCRLVVACFSLLDI